jgi:hypothetical protein
MYKWPDQPLENGEEAFLCKGKLPSSDDEVWQLRRENTRLPEERDTLNGRQFAWLQRNSPFGFIDVLQGIGACVVILHHDLCQAADYFETRIASRSSIRV